MPIDMRGLCPLIQVFDMPTSVRFYRDILGFELVSHAPLHGPDDFGWCLLRSGQAELMLNTAYDRGERPAEPDPRRIGAHDTCMYIGCPDVDAAYEYLLAKGVALKPPQVAHYGMKQLYLGDPDGFGVCFQWEATEEEKAAAQRRVRPAEEHPSETTAAAQ
jgi:catechol 2,3-dioxygenase-like lactoylglutathione lyase family enzyme